VWSLNERRPLSDLYEHIMAMHRDHGLSKLAYEDASFGSHNPNVQAMHNELAAIIKLVAESLDIPVVSYKPTSIKKFATDNGRAEKWQMVQACKLHFGKVVEFDDEADAFFVLEMAKQGLVIAGPKKPRATFRRKAAGMLFR
jgi:Holliday junction resolvasome RuvABC endonuclease subunit